MAMGAYGSWVTIATSGKINWSSNLESNYSGLTKIWNNERSETGYVSQVILGCNEEYFIEGTEHFYWRLNDSMVKHFDIYENRGNIDVLALGQNGSYIVQSNIGRASWKVDKLYGGLHQWVSQKSKIENRDIRVKLSPTRPWSSIQLMLPLT